MRKRAKNKSKKRMRQAIAKGDEPPDPLTIGAIITGTAALGAAGITAGVSAANNKAQVKAANAQAKANRKMMTPQPVTNTSALQAGEDTGLKPGQKINLINTSPQGLLGSPSVGRGTLLGN